MSDHLQMDALLRTAFSEIRDLEPTADDVTAVVRAAHAIGVRRRRPSRRRLLVAVAASLSLVGGVPLAIPDSREAIFEVFGDVGRFLSGGPFPGEPVPADERPGQLNWFGGASAASGSVIARQGDFRVVAYRDPATGYACMGYGLAIEECRPDSDWADQLAGQTVVLRGPFLQPDATGRLPLVGVVADAVVAVELRYHDGSFERVDGVAHGFAVFGDPSRDPRRLVAFGEDGAQLVSLPVADRQWVFGP